MTLPSDPREHLPADVPSSGRGGFVRLRLDVAYDGAEFHGWARQPGLRSVQSELEDALRRVLRIESAIPTRVAAAGRTDAGVHATGQVCHCDVPRSVWAGSAGVAGESGDTGATLGPEAEGGPGPEEPAHILRHRLAGVLPPDVRIHRVAPAPTGFDARWSASWRRYRYLVCDQPSAQDPRTRGFVLWLQRPLDLSAMRGAMAPFLGEHDFGAFCRQRPGASTVRTIHELGWQRVPGGLALEVRADAFCHGMVRRLVGAFLAVGAGRWPVELPASILADPSSGESAPSAPPHGLTLVEVGYPDEDSLAAQAARARRWRGADLVPYGARR